MSWGNARGEGILSYKNTITQTHIGIICMYCHAAPTADGLTRQASVMLNK